MRLGVTMVAPALQSSEVYGRVVRQLLESVCYVNRLYLEEHPETPALYSSGVSYGVVTGDDGFTFVDIPTVLDRGKGICSHLAAWRVAELREAGVNAGFRIVWNKKGNGHCFHVQVRFPNGLIEDPSENCGMRKWDF